MRCGNRYSGRWTRMMGIAVLVLGFMAPVVAGVVITRGNGSREWYGDGVVKVQDASGTMSVVTRNTVLMVMPATGKYWSGTVADYCRELKAVSGTADSVSFPKGSFTLKALGTETVAGRPAVHYQVMVDGAPLEDFWVNEEKEVGGWIRKLETDGTGLDCGNDDDSGLMVINGLDYSECIDQLSEKGLIVRRQSAGMWGNDAESEDTVTGIEVRAIAPAEVSLTPPKGLTRAASIRDLFGM